MHAAVRKFRLITWPAVANRLKGNAMHLRLFRKQVSLQHRLDCIVREAPSGYRACVDIVFTPKHAHRIRKIISERAFPTAREATDYARSLGEEWIRRNVIPGT